MLHEFVEKFVFGGIPKLPQVQAAAGIKKIVRQGHFRVFRCCTNFAIPTSRPVIANG
jgi:hypothetical protein